MNEEMNPLDFGLEERTYEDDPEKAARADAWRTAIGLQAVDGLKPSRFLIETAQKHIDGIITMDEATQRIEEHYKELKHRSRH